MTNDSTTHICLFHHLDHAKAAVEELHQAGIPDSSITTISSDGAQGSGSTLEALGVPERDLKHLRDGIRDGGVVVAVVAVPAHQGVVERIFGAHQAAKIDEAITRDEYVAPVAAAAPVAGEAVIPVVEEQLVVGKRAVDQGGVRVYSRMVETPVQETIGLREEHVVIERNPVNRAATQADFSQAGGVIELTETAEEAVVHKSARVVEEVVVGKETGQHTERVADTVKRTEVEIEELPGTTANPNTTRTL